MQKAEPLFHVLPKAREQRRGGKTPQLVLAEYAALTVSAVGCIAAAASAQVAYAATPLTLTLALNLINRYRFEQQTRANIQSNGAAIAQIDRQLQNEIEALRACVQALPSSDRVTDVEASMLRLSTLWGQLQQRIEQQPSPAEDPKIRQEFAVLRRAVVRLRDSSEANIAAVRNNLDREISLLQEKLARASEATERVELQAAIAARQALADGPAAEIAALQSQMDRMQERVADLELKNQQTVKPYLQRLVRDVKQQQSDTARIEESLGKLTESIVDLMSQIDSLGKQSDAQLYSQSIQKLSENLPVRADSAQTEAQPLRNVEFESFGPNKLNL